MDTRALTIDDDRLCFFRDLAIREASPLAQNEVCDCVAQEFEVGFEAGAVLLVREEQYGESVVDCRICGCFAESGRYSGLPSLRKQV